MRQLVVKLTDDLHHAEGEDVAADVSRMIGLDGQWYELDVTEAHSADLDAALAPFLQVARKSQSKPKVTRTYTRRSPVPAGQERPAATKTARTAHLAEIRAWARDSGYAVAPRGRISAHIVELYEAARPDQAAKDTAPTMTEAAART